MKHISTIIAVALTSTILLSCTPKQDDFEGREAEISKRIEKLDAESIYVDLIMLYLDIIEDVHNQGRETGEYDLARLEAFENGILVDFQEKISFQSREMLEEIFPGYEKSLKERMDEIEPLINEMYNSEENSEEDIAQLEDGSIIIDNDTIKQLEDTSWLVNGDTLSNAEFLAKYAE